MIVEHNKEEGYISINGMRFYEAYFENFVELKASLVARAFPTPWHRTVRLEDGSITGERMESNA